MNPNAPLHERIAAVGHTLTTSEAQVAAFMSVNPGVVAVSSTAELGQYTGTSDATVVRTTRKLGYPSFRELRRSALVLSGRHWDPSRVLDDQLGQITNSRFGAKRVLKDTIDLLVQLEAGLDAESWDRAVAAVSDARRVVTYGIGPSGALADYLSISLRRIGIRCSSIKTTGLALADDLLDLRPGDVVILFATLRRFREIDVVIDQATAAGAVTILISETLGEALRNRVDVILGTPLTTTSTSDGVVMGVVVACALRLSVAAQRQAAAVSSVERLNAIRADIVGGPLDVSE